MTHLIFLTQDSPMRRSLFAAMLLASLCLPTVGVAQGGADLLRRMADGPEVTAPTFPAPTNLAYKVSWDVTAGPTDPAELVAGFRRPAGFLRQMDQQGVPRKNVKLAIIVHGTATRSLLNNAAYRAATGKDNASIALLEALNEAGVQIIVCGQALINRNVPRADLLPFVKVATSATAARAILAAQGYATWSE
jgi:intracellular sulfur oxidation DsrE/DsrF family protein